MDLTIFYILLPVVAFLYASVGHGGASGYIALMILFSFAEHEWRSTALILNICVSAVAFFNYWRKKHFHFQIFLIVGIISIPAAYLGGRTTLDKTYFNLILGIFLLISIAKLLGLFDLRKKQDDRLMPPNIAVGILIGSSVGFLSGLLSIGGGILLTPILLFLRWTTIKEAAGISALFIFVNSLAGLLGRASENDLYIHPNLLLLIALALAGGSLGGYLGSTKFNNAGLRYMLSAVLLIATYKLFFG